MIDSVTLSYIAAFWEGEGNAGLYSKGAGRIRQLAVDMAQKNPKVLYWIRDVVGNELIEAHVQIPNGKKCPRLRMRGINAKMFLMLIYPYLKFRQDEVTPLIV